MPATTLSLIVDLACFLIQHHAMRVKYFALRSGMLPKVGGVELLVSLSGNVCVTCDQCTSGLAKPRTCKEHLRCL